MAEYQILTDEQRRQLNDIYIGIVKKYKSSATESVNLDFIPQISYEDADNLAELELGAKRDKIISDYNDLVDNINANASRRGLANSSIALKQLTNAYQKMQNALNLLDGRQEQLAKKIVSDNRKLILGFEREKAASKSRSLRDYIAVSKMKNTVVVNIQNLIDEELYSAYLEWLLQYPINIAFGYVNDNTLFLTNMGAAKWQQLLTEMTNRKAVQ